MCNLMSKVSFWCEECLCEQTWLPVFPMSVLALATADLLHSGLVFIMLNPQAGSFEAEASLADTANPSCDCPLPLHTSTMFSEQSSRDVLCVPSWLAGPLCRVHESLPSIPMSPPSLYSLCSLTFLHDSASVPSHISYSLIHSITHSFTFLLVLPIFMEVPITCLVSETDKR